MNMPPPQKRIKHIKISEAARYVRTHHHADCTRQTVYNWVKSGVKGVKLKVHRIGAKMLTTKEWIDEFLDDTAKF